MKLKPWLAGAITFFATTVVASAEYPEKPIEMLINYGVGGNADTSGRIFIEALKTSLNAKIIPINIEGAGGTIGTAQAAKADADGYTLLFSPVAPVTVQPHVRKLTYQRDDLEPVCGVTQNQMAVTVAPDSPYNSLEDLVAAQKSGETIISTGPAPGSVPYIAQAALANALGITFAYSPVGNGAKQAKAIVSGDATLATDNTANGTRYGLKTIAVISDEPVQGYEDVPTTKELGINLPLTLWYGVFAPKGTPEPILNSIADACAVAVKDAQLMKHMKAADIVIKYRSRKDFKTFYLSQYEDNKSLLNLIGIKAQ